MSYSANNYNYATPLSSSTGLVGAESVVPNRKFVVLGNNVLDGSHSVISGDVGLWSASVSDVNGVFSTPFVVTITENITVNSYRLVCDVSCYPVAFTVRFYNNDALTYTITEINNNSAEYLHYMPRTVTASSVIITITKVSRANAAARLYNLYNVPYVKRADNFRVRQTSTSVHTQQLYKSSFDMLSVAHANSRQLSVELLRSDRVPTKTTELTEIGVTAKNADNATMRVAEKHSVRNTIDVRKDVLRLKHANRSHIRNTIDKTADTVKPLVVENTSHVINVFDPTGDTLTITTSAHCASDIANVHSRMKAPSRRIFGKVYITYTDPMMDSSTTMETSPAAYNSQIGQIIDANVDTNGKFFTLYENNLSGQYIVSDKYSQVGFVSAELSDSNGNFGTPAPFVKYNFSSRPVTDLPIVFDGSRGAVPADFTVVYEQADGSKITKTFVDNTSATVTINDSIADVVAITITVTRLTKPNYPVAILEMMIASTILYTGYQDKSELMSIDLLEELAYTDEVEALGGISANEVTVTLDNSRKDFYFNNADSIVAKQLKRNRKVIPWLGVEIIPGTVEWYTLGTYWSYSWDVPVGGLTAKVVAFDTLGLLDTTSFTNHQTQVNKTLYDLVKYVLDDAKAQLGFITYSIDSALKDVTIPYAWFEASSHTAALRKLSMCYPMHVYCNRDGAICAAPQKLGLDYYYDVWSDKTNVISKTYSSLYTTVPNIVNVTVNRPSITDNESLTVDELLFNVRDVPSRTLVFGSPYISGIRVEVTCDPAVTYTYSVYSWGIVVNFAGSGNVSKIECFGTALDISNTSIITRRDDTSVRLNGAVVRDIQSDFIQTSQHATLLLDRINELSVNDRYDVEVQYRGDIALSINDPILLLDGIAPDNRYNIKRHKLFWDGALHGVANLNT